MTEWQEHELRFSGTVDSRTDRKQIAAPNFESLTNAEFNERGALIQRNGLRDLSTNIFPSGNMLNGSGITFSHDNLLGFDGRHAYAYSPTLGKWVLKGAVGDIRVHAIPINNQDSKTSSSAVAYNVISGYLAYVYQDSIGSSYLTIVDTITNLTIVDGALLTVSNIILAPVKAVSVGSNIFFAVTNNASQIAIYRIDTTSITPTTPILVATTADASLGLTFMQNFDLTAFSATTCYIVYRTSAIQIRTRSITTAGFVASATQATAAVGPVAIANSFDGTKIMVVWADGTTKGITYTTALAVATPASTVSPVNGANILTVIGVGINTYSVYANVPSIPTATLSFTVPVLNKYDVTDVVGIGYAVQSSPPIYNLVLGSKPFTVVYGATSVQYITVHASQDAVFTAGFGPAGVGPPPANTTAVHTGNSWGSYLISSVFSSSGPPDTEIMTRANIGFQPLMATNSSGANFLSLGDVANISGSGRFKAIVSMPYVITSTLLSSSTGAFPGVPSTIPASSSAVISTSYEFYKPIRSYCQAGANTFIGGSQLMEYDGSNIVEHGFYFSPDVRAAMSTTANSGNFANGYVVSIAVVYSWVDDLGNKHYSAPTFATTTTNAANRAIIVEATTCPTYKQNSKIEFYCTLDGGSIYYFNGDTNNVSNSPVVQKIITFRPSGGETALYTTGGVIASSTIATADYIHEHNGRLFAIINGRDLYYSKKWQVGTGISMTPAQSGPLPAEDGDAIALESLDDNLVIFKSGSIYIQGGDGPNNLGIGSFSGPQKIITDVGCQPESAGSVIRLPIGVMFKSVKGFHILTRDFTSQPLSEMDSLKSQISTSAILVQSKDNVIMTLNNSFGSDQQWVIYNYIDRRWGLGSGNYRHVGVTRSIGVPGSTSFPSIAFIDSQGTARIEQSGVFIDSNASGVPSFPPITITTGWINLAGIQGYERIRRFGIVMENAQESFFVSVYYDYSDTPVESFTFPAIASQGHREVRQRIGRQRCESIKFQLIYSPSGGLVVSSMMLELGVVGGIYRRNG